MGVFNRIFAGLAAKGGAADQLMIDETHRTAAGLLEKGARAMLSLSNVSGAPKGV